MLIDAYAQYLRQTQASALADAPWHLVLLGDGGLRPALEAQRRSLGLEACIHMPGFKSYGELPAYYGLADGFVHASLTEQWGLVVNEAMAAGLPVLVSDRCGCVADLVREGENGFTFSPGDKEALVARMTMLATGACNREAMKGASRAIVAKWNVGAFAKGLQQALGMAMSAPTPRIGGLSRSTMWLLMRWQACTED
jgi:glycosyltransferase involved in cell wall biosynthesis